MSEIKSLQVRLEELRQYEPGWHDGEGEKITEAALTVAFNVMQYLLLAHAFGQKEERPSIYPVPDGGIQIEWELTERSNHLQITPVGTKVVLTSVGTAKFSFDYYEREFGPTDYQAILKGIWTTTIL